MSALADVAPVSLEHDAFVYSSDEEFVDVLVPLVHTALAAGNRVFSVVSRNNARLLRRALGAAAADVTWIEAEEWYQHPVRTIAAYERTLRGLPAGVAAFVIGEVQFGDGAGAHAEWTRYEALLNRVLEHYPARVICPYDARRLPSAIVADAERTHPNLVQPAARPHSDRYVEPEALVGQLTIERHEPAAPPDLVVEDITSPRVGRLAFAEAAAASGFEPDRVSELELAVSELLTNAILHGGGVATLRVWRGDTLECIVDDGGPGSEDVLLGFGPPAPDTVGGYGLWCARQVFDQVELSRSPLGGLRVHASVHR